MIFEWKLLLVTRISKNLPFSSYGVFGHCINFCQISNHQDLPVCQQKSGQMSALYQNIFFWIFCYYFEIHFVCLFSSVLKSFVYDFTGRIKLEDCFWIGSIFINHGETWRFNYHIIFFGRTSAIIKFTFINRFQTIYKHNDFIIFINRWLW